MSEKKERICFNCVHLDLCFLVHGITNVITDSDLNINISKPDTPGARGDIFKALANCCSRYFELLEPIFEKE